MPRKYYRPLIVSSADKGDKAFKLADGWAFFNNVEVIQRNEETSVIKAEDLPDDMLDRLTKKRKEILNLSFSIPHVMGILNLTPDSFSDGGLFIKTDSALNEIKKIVEFGASVIDIGGESTRPGADPITACEEIDRIIPILKKIRYSGIETPISIDTRKSEVWKIANEFGANMLNDISSLSYDKEMKNIIANENTPLCVMHSKGLPKTMKLKACYSNVLLDVYDYLENIVEYCVNLGIPRKNIIVDPGIGFAKTLEHNLTILRGISIFHGLGCPILLGASRKRFIGTIGAEENPLRLSSGSVAVALEAVNQGVQVLRVHDVFETIQALRLWKSIKLEIS